MRRKEDLQRAQQREAIVADYLPFGSLVRPDICKLTSGSYAMTWRLEGIAFETVDATVLDERKKTINSLLRAISGGHFSLWTHRTRRRVQLSLPAHFDVPYCQELNERYQATISAKPMMATELYLTLVYRPNIRGRSFFARMKARSKEDILAAEEAAMSTMLEAAQTVEATLTRFGPERLGERTEAGRTYSELSTFYGYLVNGVWEPQAPRAAQLRHCLPSSRLHFGAQNGFLQIEHPSCRKFAGFLDIQEYPTWGETGMLHSLLYGDFEYIETQSFSLLGKRDALEALRLQKGQMQAGEEASAKEVADMDAVMDEVRGGEVEMGTYHYTLCVFGETLAAASKNLADAREAFDQPQCKVTTIDLVPEAAWFASCPGNWDLRPRTAKLTSFNFACLSSLHNFAAGKRSGNPWGEAVTLLKTPSGQPYYLNFHSSPDDEDNTDDKLPGNTIIIGQTGSGKTTAELFFVSEAQKYRPRLVVFDKDRGADLFIRRMGGKYRTFAIGEPTGINPFQWPDTPANRAFCSSLMRQCMSSDGARFTPKDVNDINAAVDATFAMDWPLRRVSGFDQNLPLGGSDGLRPRLRKWLAGESLGWVFDNPADTLDLHSGRIFGFDYTEFLDRAEIRTPIMMVLLEAIKTLIDGTPFIFVMAEFWKPLLDPIFVDFARDQLKTIRKNGGLGIFDTQEPTDAIAHEIGKTIIQQCVTKVFLPNGGADRADYVDGFKVSEQEFEIIRALPENSRLMLVKQGQKSAVVSLDLKDLPEDLIFLSGSRDNVLLLDEIRKELGTNDPDAWVPELLDRVGARRRRSREDASERQERIGRRQAVAPSLAMADEGGERP